MLLTSAAEEAYCLKTNAHSPVRIGSNLICYRCGFLIGPVDREDLGSLLDV